jgi:hypothetical protein
VALKQVKTLRFFKNVKNTFKKKLMLEYSKRISTILRSLNYQWWLIPIPISTL